MSTQLVKVSKSTPMYGVLKYRKVRGHEDSDAAKPFWTSEKDLGPSEEGEILCQSSMLWAAKTFIDADIEAETKELMLRFGLSADEVIIKSSGMDETRPGRRVEEISIICCPPTEEGTSFEYITYVIARYEETVRYREACKEEDPSTLMCLDNGADMCRWVDLREGVNGDYNPKDPNDRKLLRLDFLIRVSKDLWEPLDGASCCTCMSADVSDEVLEAGLRIAMRKFGTAEMSHTPFKAFSENLSYLDDTAVMMSHEWVDMKLARLRELLDVDMSGCEEDWRDAMTQYLVSHGVEVNLPVVREEKGGDSK